MKLNVSELQIAFIIGALIGLGLSLLLINPTHPLKSIGLRELMALAAPVMGGFTAMLSYAICVLSLKQEVKP